MSKPCNCMMPMEHARAVESAVFNALHNIILQPEREDYWRSFADKIEQKFTTAHGKHYSLMTGRNRSAGN